MAIVQQYPLKTPKNSDLLVGTSIPDPNTNDDPKTSSFSVSSIGSFLITQNNIITGGGTLNTIPMFTPDGQKIGNSIITQNALGTTIAVNGGLTVDGTLTVGNVSAGEGGEVTFSGNVVIGDGLGLPDYLTISSSVQDSNAAIGTEGQILVANSSSRLIWSSINAVSEIKTAQATITDAQIQTLGTVPVEILPGVSGYIYEILGITTTSINSGGLGDSYDWSASGDGVIYGRGFLPTEHRVEVSNANLPGGGPLIGDSYVATPIAGTFRHGAGVKVSTTLGVDPTIPVGQTPVAQWVINITYRLIQVE